MEMGGKFSEKLQSTPSNTIHESGEGKEVVLELSYMRVMNKEQKKQVRASLNIDYEFQKYVEIQKCVIDPPYN